MVTEDSLCDLDPRLSPFGQLMTLMVRYSELYRVGEKGAVEPLPAAVALRGGPQAA